MYSTSDQSGGEGYGTPASPSAALSSVQQQQQQQLSQGPQQTTQSQQQAPDSPQQEQVAPFVRKLHELVGDTSTAHLVSWSTESPNAFTVFAPAEFASTVLPRYFKHSNFSSFIRQLNIYGFRKTESRVGCSFFHEHFGPGHTTNLKEIRRRKTFSRKTASQKSSPPGATPAAPTPAQQPPPLPQLVSQVQQPMLSRQSDLAQPQQPMLNIAEEIAALQERNRVRAIQAATAAAAAASAAQQQQDLLSEEADRPESPIDSSGLVLPLPSVQQQQQQPQQQSQQQQAPLGVGQSALAIRDQIVAYVQKLEREMSVLAQRRDMREKQQAAAAAAAAAAAQQQQEQGALSWDAADQD